MQEFVDNDVIPEFIVKFEQFSVEIQMAIR